MIKSTFNTGIDSPLKVALLDRRIKNPSEAIFGGIQGNLAYGKIMFTCNPNIGVSLRDKEINQILCLAHNKKEIKWSWTDQDTETVRKIKGQVKTLPDLYNPSPTDKPIIECDASFACLR